jgi:uncharacterized protein with GYD domain
MPRYIFICSYSSGSWARLMRVTDDRVDATNRLMEYLGGNLRDLYWEAGGRAAYAIADMPDSATVAAAIAVITHTGAFKSVEAAELLTQEQLNKVLELADNAAGVYDVPGHLMLSNDSSSRRFQR